MAPALIVLALTGCKEATLGPVQEGGIEGQVVDYVTGVPIANAAITTTPASEAVLTDGEGNFQLDDLEAGSYQVTARKSGYSPSTVAIAVKNDRTSSAVIFLEEEDEDAAADSPLLDVQVTSFWNTTEGDSTYVEAEYRVRNDGGVAATAYEVYFRIETTGDTYYFDETGEALGVGQADVRRFKSFIQSSSATAVEVEDVWTDPSASH